MTGHVGIGNITHRRFIDKPHEFKYNVFMMHLDLDRIKNTFDNYWLWSYEKFNIACFKQSNYLKNKKGPLIDNVKQLVKEKIGENIDRVFLLTNLACFGYCFNPISVYFCFCQNKMKAFIIEVTNTPWGESHQYVLAPSYIKDDLYFAKFKKKLHVSPFLMMEYEYHMRCKYQENKIILHIKNIYGMECHFDATLNLTLKPINHYNLAKSLLKFPFMTGKVVQSIF